MSTLRIVPTSLVRRAAAIVALCALVATGTATWLTSSTASAKPVAAKAAAAPSAAAAAKDDDEPRARGGKKQVTGKLNLNSASDEQLQMLPGVGPSKSERIIAWRQKNGGFKRVADLRKVKGFGYKTLKKLEPYLDIKGETNLRAE
jgi:competence protein ComEA